MKDPVAIRYAAFAVVCALIGGAVWPLHSVSYSFFALSGFFAVGAILNIARALREDKYSLSSLQKVHEKAELDEIEVPGGNDLDSVLCFCCGTAYSDRFPVCPKCGTGPRRC